MASVNSSTLRASRAALVAIDAEEAKRRVWQAVLENSAAGLRGQRNGGPLQLAGRIKPGPQAGLRLASETGVSDAPATSPTSNLTELVPTSMTALCRFCTLDVAHAAGASRRSKGSAPFRQSCGALFGFAARQDGAADYAGVISGFAGHDFNALVRAVHGIILGRLHDNGHHFVTQGVDDAAAQRHGLRVENIDQVRHRDAGVLGGVFNYFLDQFSPLRMALPK